MLDRCIYLYYKNIRVNTAISSICRELSQISSCYSVVCLDTKYGNIDLTIKLNCHRMSGNVG